MEKITFFMEVIFYLGKFYLVIKTKKTLIMNEAKEEDYIYQDDLLMFDA
jgi:hypothetical protein